MELFIAPPFTLHELPTRQTLAPCFSGFLDITDAPKEPAAHG